MRKINLAELLLSGSINTVVILGAAWLFCWGLGAYTLRKSLDALFFISFVHTLFGMAVWWQRIQRFYFLSGQFRGETKATAHDRPEWPPARRRWLLVIGENQIFVAWAVVGILMVLATAVVGMLLPPRYAEDTVLPFLVRSDLPFYVQPDG